MAKSYLDLLSSSELLPDTTGASTSFSTGSSTGSSRGSAGVSTTDFFYNFEDDSDAFSNVQRKRMDTEIHLMSKKDRENYKNILKSQYSSGDEYLDGTKGAYKYGCPNIEEEFEKYNLKMSPMCASGCSGSYKPCSYDICKTPVYHYKDKEFSKVNSVRGNEALLEIDVDIKHVPNEVYRYIWNDDVEIVNVLMKRKGCYKYNFIRKVDLRDLFGCISTEHSGGFGVLFIVIFIIFILILLCVGFAYNRKK